MTAKTSRIIHYGNELFHTIEQSNLKESFKVTYWDLWIAILLLNQFDNNWEEMIVYLRLKQKGNRHLRKAFESLSNHILMLRQKLTKNGLTHTDLIVDTDKGILKKHETKAKRKILEMHFQPKERSSWMINTPRKYTEMRAFYGHWDHFPVNPEKYAVSFKKLYKSGFYTKNQTHTLERKLSNYIEKHERRASISELFALYRAIMTVITIKMDMVDDSYGLIGGLFEEIFVKYYSLERESLEMPPEDFFLDLIELMIWEDYGGTYEQEEVFFKRLNSSEIPLVESILQKQLEELNQLELNYQAEKALTYLGMLYTENQLFDKFVSIAKEMGTRHWKRITSMSEMAEKHNKGDLAMAIYEACLEPGDHEQFLRKQYEELKKRLKKNEIV